MVNVNASKVNRFLGWLKTHFTPVQVGSPQNADRYLDSSKLSDASKWAGGGFVALVAVLTFFQIKDGILDQLLRLNATTALWIFLLIGLGVTGSLFAGAFKDGVVTPMPVVIIGLLLLAALTSHFLRNIAEKPSSDTNLLLIGCLAGLVLLLAATRNIFIGTAAAVLILAVAATSMGLYGAAKLSVMAKTYVSVARVTASLSNSDAVDSVNITAKADQRGEKALFVSLVGTVVATPDVPARDVVLGTVRLTPDAGGSIDASTSIPVQSALWDHLSVRSCDNLPCSAGSEAVSLSGGREPATLPRVSGALSPNEGGKEVEANLAATDLPIDWVVTTYVVRINADRGETLVAQGAATTNATGVAEWKVVHLIMGEGKRIELRYDFCSPPASECLLDNATTVGVLTLADGPP